MPDVICHSQVLSDYRTPTSYATAFRLSRVVSVGPITIRKVVDGSRDMQVYMFDVIVAPDHVIPCLCSPGDDESDSLSRQLRLTEEYRDRIISVWAQVLA